MGRALTTEETAKVIWRPTGVIETLPHGGEGEYRIVEPHVESVDVPGLDQPVHFQVDKVGPLVVCVNDTPHHPRDPQTHYEFYEGPEDKYEPIVLAEEPVEPLKLTAAEKQQLQRVTQEDDYVDDMGQPKFDKDGKWLGEDDPHAKPLPHWDLA